MAEKKRKQQTQVLFERCRNMTARQHLIQTQSVISPFESYTSPTKKLALRRINLDRIKSLSFERRLFSSPKIVRATHDFTKSKLQLTRSITKNISVSSFIGTRQKRMIDPNFLLDKPLFKKPCNPLIKKPKLFLMNLPLVV